MIDLILMSLYIVLLSFIIYFITFIVAIYFHLLSVLVVSYLVFFVIGEGLTKIVIKFAYIFYSQNLRNSCSIKFIEDTEFSDFFDNAPNNEAPYGWNSSNHENPFPTYQVDPYSNLREIRFQVILERSHRLDNYLGSHNFSISSHNIEEM